MSRCNWQHRPQREEATRPPFLLDQILLRSRSSPAPSPRSPGQSSARPEQLPKARPGMNGPVRCGRLQGQVSWDPVGPQKKKKRGDVLPKAGLWEHPGPRSRRGRLGTARRGGDGRVRQRRGGPLGYLRRRAGPALLGRVPPPRAALGLPPHATCGIGPVSSLPQPTALRRAVRPPVSDSPGAPGDDEGRSGRPAELCSVNFRLLGAAASNNSPSLVGHCACAAHPIRDLRESGAAASNNSRGTEPEGALAQLSQIASRRTFPPPFPDQAEREE